MIVRPATPRDRPAIARLLAASWRETYRNDLPAEFLGPALDARMAERWGGPVPPEEFLLVAEIPGEPGLAGFLCAFLRPEETYIDNLHADPARRGRGAGAALMRAGARAFLGMGRTAMHLHVMEGKAGALRFYARLGGEIDPAPHATEFQGRTVQARGVRWPDLTRLPEG